MISFYLLYNMVVFIFTRPALPAHNFSLADLVRIDSTRILTAAEKYVHEAPITITAFKAVRSCGGLHDFYSEGDYWWPDPQNPQGPYIRKDGMTNPDNFIAHRQALMNMSIKVTALAAAYRISGKTQYAQATLKHLAAWFIDPHTRMNPNLLYAQAIKGITTGRGIGIIDTIHLVEVVQAIRVLEKAGVIEPNTLSALKHWFRQYLVWLTTHQNGLDERDNGNNHSTCWALQAAEYAKFVGDTRPLAFCRTMFTEVLIPRQMAADGSFPKELARTKPYGYSLFNLDVMSMLCQILSDRDHDFWNFKTGDGRGMRAALAFLFPFILDKGRWPYPADVMHFEHWPIRHPCLLFAGIHFNEQKYLALWQTLNPDPVVEEVIRNFPIRQPVLWME